MKTLVQLFAASGVLLLLPSACAIVTGSLTRDDDWSVAFTPVTRMSLDSLRAGTAVELIFRVPDSAQWERIRQQPTMGDHGYIVLGTNHRGNKLIPFGAMDLAVTVSSAAGPIELNKTDKTPYGYSSDTFDAGLRFHPKPRDEVHVSVTARRPDRLPKGELIIEPYWTWSAKDFGVGASIDRDLSPFVIRITWLGFVLLAAGVAGELVRRGRRNL